jgi:hypothetical protein
VRRSAWTHNITVTIHDSVLTVESGISYKGATRRCTKLRVLGTPRTQHSSTVSTHVESPSAQWTHRTGAKTRNITRGTGDRANGAHTIAATKTT